MAGLRAAAVSLAAVSRVPARVSCRKQPFRSASELQTPQLTMAYAQTAAQDGDFWKRLLHRWFIEYNPFYIVSAGLVVAGVNLISGSLPGVHAQLGVAAIAEVYAWALIAAAAWLTRTGCRRPAVMLALLVAVYQCDPTLHTETCVYLGFAGVVAALVWLASFVAKLYALTRALHLRSSRSAIAIPTFGAAGLLIIPRFFEILSGAGINALIACWLFALFASALWSERAVTSAVPLDSWGQTVLRRGTRATWLIWAVLGTSHAIFWLDEAGLGPGALLPVALLLGTRWIRRESAVWCAVSATVLLAGTALPGVFSVTALLAACALALRGMRLPTEVVFDADPVQPTAPYRGTVEPRPLRSSPLPEIVFMRADHASLVRLMTGSVVGLYLSLWTTSWTGGPWPNHGLFLDLLLTAAMVVLFWRTRMAVALLPLFATYLHFAVQTRLVSAPTSRLEWGVASVALGFALLSASLAVTWRLRKATD